MRGRKHKTISEFEVTQKYMDEADDLSSKAVIEYFEEHNLDQLRWRLYYDYRSDAGVGRFMRNVWIEYMDGFDAELTEFYEKTRRRKLHIMKT